MNKILNFGRFVINDPMNKNAEWLEKNMSNFKILTDVFPVRTEERYTYDVYTGGVCKTYDSYTPTVGVAVEFENYSGKIYCILLGGYDCIRYNCCNSDNIEAMWFGDDLINIEFIGQTYQERWFDSKDKANDYLKSILGYTCSAIRI